MLERLRLSMTVETYKASHPANMKTIFSITFAIFLICLSSCVQPSYEREIQFLLRFPSVQKPDNVAVRGNDSPLSWEKDYPLVFDTLKNAYVGTVKLKTGYRFTEFKFVADGTFELEQQPNRRLNFKDRSKIEYVAVFNKKQEE